MSDAERICACTCRPLGQPCGEPLRGIELTMGGECILCHGGDHWQEGDDDPAFRQSGGTMSIPGWPTGVGADAPTAKRNTFRTYVKTGVLSVVLGIPFGFGLSIFVSLLGFYVGWGIAVWIAGRIFGLKGKAAYVVVYVATVVIQFLIFVVMLIGMEGRIREILDQSKPVGFLLGSFS
jgi:hypothetical protein